MKKYFYALVAVVLVSASGCKEDNPVDDKLVINFKATFENQPLILKSTYTDASGKKWKFEDLNFYFSELKLIKDDGTTVAISDMGYVDFKDASTTSVTFKNIPLGRFTGIQFNTGLTPAQNNEEQNLLPENDIRNLGLYWPWLKYAFVRLGGRADINNSNTFNTLLVYHIGGDELLRTATLNKALEIKAGESTINISLQVDKIFTTEPTLDISMAEESYSHSDKNNKDNYPTAIKFADNFPKAFTLN